MSNTKAEISTKTAWVLNNLYENNLIFFLVKKIVIVCLKNEIICSTHLQ